MEKELDPLAGVVDVYPQEFTRVMLNLIGNAFYAARRRAEQTLDKRFEPTLRLATRDLGEQVEIRVRDNGTGISDAVRGKDLRAVLHHQAGRRGHRARPLAQLRHRRQAARRAIDRGQPARRLHRIRHHPAAQDGGQRRSADMTDLLPSAAADIERMEGELQALRAELAARNSEFGERIEHQAATIEVLKAMSASPGDAQPVFDLIARQAAKLCNVPTAAVATFDGTMLHLATQSGFDAAYADAYVSQFPRPVGLDSSMGRAILNRRVDQVEDITADPGHSFGEVLGHWSVMAVPILRDGVPLGAITIGRPAMGPFSDSQVALLQTFAEQAVIAITSAETYRELQERTAALTQRNSEYGERIEHQAATIDVLKTMSASPGDPQPVFDLIARRANELCDGAVLRCSSSMETMHFRGNRHPRIDPEGQATYLAIFPRPWTEPGHIPSTGQFWRRRSVHVPRLRGDPPSLDPVAKRSAEGQSRFRYCGRDADRRDDDWSTGPGRIRRQPDRAAADLRRAGSDCDHAVPRHIASCRNAPRR